MTYNIEISKDLDISYQDEGPWRSYQLEAMGNDIEQLWDNAFIYELDQDGGELNLYHVLEAPKHVFEKAEAILKNYQLKLVGEDLNRAIKRGIKNGTY